MKYINKVGKIEDEELQSIKKEIDFEYIKENITQTIEDIRQGGYRTAEIVKGLRTFSHFSDEQFKKADIHEGIESTLMLVQSSLKKGITLEKNYSPTLEAIDCYPDQLNQVFMNILVNAVHALQTGGVLTITTKDEGKNVSVSIKDTGPGIAPAIKDKIFDPFFTTKEIGEGTGLGLSISYGIIEKHNGKIEVISEEDRGTEFLITLPKTQNKS